MRSSCSQIEANKPGWMLGRAVKAWLYKPLFPAWRFCIWPSPNKASHIHSLLARVRPSDCYQCTRVFWEHEGIVAENILCCAQRWTLPYWGKTFYPLPVHVFFCGFLWVWLSDGVLWLARNPFFCQMTIRQLLTIWNVSRRPSKSA